MKTCEFTEVRIVLARHHHKVWKPILNARSCYLNININREIETKSFHHFF